MIHTYVKQTIIPLTLLIIIMIANDVFGSPIIEPQKLYTKQVSNFEENKGQITGVDADRVKFSFNTENLMVFLLSLELIAHLFYFGITILWKPRLNMLQPIQR